MFNKNESSTIEVSAKPISLSHLTKSIEGKNELQKLLVLVTFWSGLRVSEVVNIRAGDFERTPEGYRLHLRRSKNLSRGEVGFRNLFRSSKIKTKELCPVRILDLLLPTIMDLDYLFAGDNGHITIRTAQRRIKSILGPEYSPHSLRHGVLHMAIENGVLDTKLLKMISGHKSTESLDRYIKAATPKKYPLSKII